MYIDIFVTRFMFPCFYCSVTFVKMIFISALIIDICDWSITDCWPESTSPVLRTLKTSRQKSYWLISTKKGYMYLLASFPFLWRIWSVLIIYFQPLFLNIFLKVTQIVCKTTYIWEKQVLGRNVVLNGSRFINFMGLSWKEGM